MYIFFVLSANYFASPSENVQQASLRHGTDVPHRVHVLGGRVQRDHQGRPWGGADRGPLAALLHPNHKHHQQLCQDSQPWYVA